MILLIISGLIPSFVNDSLYASKLPYGTYISTFGEVLTANPAKKVGGVGFLNFIYSNNNVVAKVPDSKALTIRCPHR